MLGRAVTIDPSPAYPGSLIYPSPIGSVVALVLSGNLLLPVPRRAHR